MKHLNLLKSFLLLCALVVGSNSVYSYGVYKKVTTTPSDWSGIYLIVYEGNSTHEACAFDGALTTLDAASDYVSVTISSNIINGSEKIDAATFTIAKSGDNYTIKSASGYYIGSTKFDNKLISSTSTSYPNSIELDESSNAVIKSNLSGTATTLRYNYASDQLRFRYYKSGQQAIALYRLVNPVTVTSAGYATFCSESALDFTDVDDVTAYTASISDNTVTFNKVTTTVPAGTGLLLKGDAGTYNIPVVASSTTDVSANKLVGVTEATEIDGTAGNFYVLKKVGENVGFYKVTSDAYTVRANSAYLNGEGVNAKDFIGFDNDETTAIDNLTISQFVKNAPVYNLAGQKVSNSYKGIVIVNGKKYINK
jgi:hypothetical protein